jgi:ABC-type branched-subunit amino acid transport system substrate-binding protein
MRSYRETYSQTLIKPVQMNRKIPTLLLVSGLIALLSFVLKPGANRKLPKKYVAYIGFNHTDSAKAANNHFDDTLHLLALREYLRALNQQQGKPGFEYALKSFQCDFQEDTIKTLYQSILQDTNIHLVIDNTWGVYLRKADTLIRGKLPVISMTADQNSLDFGNNAIFLEPNDRQPFYLVNFIKKVLGNKNVGFITEDDYLLHGKFEEAFKNYGLDAHPIFTLKQGGLEDNQVTPSDSIRLLPEIIESLAAAEEEVILLNLHTAYGNLLMKALQQAPKGKIKPKTFIGISYYTDLAESELQALTQEKKHRFLQYETNQDILPEAVYLLGEELKKRNPEAFFNSSGLKSNLLRCYDAINIFRAVLKAIEATDNEPHERSKPDNMTQAGFRSCREKIVQGFQKLPGRKIVFGNELYDFDSSLILKKEPSFSVIEAGKTQTYMEQINTNGEGIPNLHVGVDILDINEINVRKNTFNGNLLYWVIANKEYIDKEGFINFSSVVSPGESRTLIAEEKDKTGSVTRLYRISGEFAGNFESFDFPFDQHDIKIPIESLSSSDDIKISFDYSRLDQKAKKLKAFEMNDWITDSYYVTLDNSVSNTIATRNRFTSNTKDSAMHLEKYKTLHVHLNARRQPWGAIILIIFPFVMFSALPLFMIFFHTATFQEVLELIITSFLATVAYSINLVQISPATDSMNLAYIFLILTLGINFLCFIVYLFSKGKQKTPERSVVAEPGSRQTAGKTNKMKIGYIAAALAVVLAVELVSRLL